MQGYAVGWKRGSKVRPHRAHPFNFSENADWRGRGDPSGSELFVQNQTNFPLKSCWVSLGKLIKTLLRFMAPQKTWAWTFLRYRAYRLQWHQLQWQIGYSDNLDNSQPMHLLIKTLCLQWHIAYSDTLLCPDTVIVSNRLCTVLLSLYEKYWVRRATDSQGFVNPCTM